MNLDQARQRMAVKLTLMIFVIILFSTIVLPLLIEQHAVFTYFGLLNTALSGILYFYLSTSENRPWHPYLMLMAFTAILLPITIISGGINSQFISLFPLICILMCLVATPKAAWGVAIFIVSLLLFLYFAGDWFPILDPEPANDNKTIARLFWLVMACLLATSFGTQFDRINSNLGSRLKEQFNIDGLTGLLNRGSILALLDDNLERARSEKRWLSVVMLDLDYFRSINDMYGHLAGDQCLRKVSACLKHLIRNGDDYVGRYDGAQFIVVLNDVDQSTAMKIGEKIRAAIEDMPMLVEGEKISLSATLGLLQFAKVITYTAKNNCLMKPKKPW